MRGTSSLERPVDFPDGPVSRDQLVSWLRSRPDQAEFLRACYQDQPETDAAERFRSSDEWQAALSLLLPPPGRAVDLGGGNGVASYALARSGWDVVAVEPSASPVTGGTAISQLLRSSDLPPAVVHAVGEHLPLSSGSVDIVYSRQVLHHVADPTALCRELRRVLRPGGMYLACAEHVVSNDRQRRRFLAHHPMNRFTEDEDAFRLKDYRRAFVDGGLDLVGVLRPFDSPINFAPYSSDGLREEFESKLSSLPGGQVVARRILSPRLYPFLLRVLSRAYRRPGRAYTFVARRPG